MSVNSLRLDPVEVFAPFSSEEQSVSRRRLLKARDLATAKSMRTRNSRVRQLMWIVQVTAAEWVFARASAEDLKYVADALVRLFQAARALEEVEGDDDD